MCGICGEAADLHVAAHVYRQFGDTSSLTRCPLCSGRWTWPVPLEAPSGRAREEAK
jgi:hypothetical protein